MTDQHLTPSMARAVALGEARLAEGDENMSAHALRAALRKQRIDNDILTRKLAHANLQIERLKASRALAAELAAADEPSCP